MRVKQVTAHRYRLYLIESTGEITGCIDAVYDSLSEAMLVRDRLCLSGADWTIGVTETIDDKEMGWVG